MDFAPEGLTTQGLAGFVTWNDLSWDEVPASPGVYVVVRDSLHPPRSWAGIQRAGSRSVIRR